MTTDELASLSGRGIRTIKRHITGMQRLKFIGSGANGYWFVGPKVENPKSKKGNQASEQVSEQVSGQAGGQVSGQVSGQVGGLLNETIQKMLLLIGRNYLSIFDIQKAANISSKKICKRKDVGSGNRARFGTYGAPRQSPTSQTAILSEREGIETGGEGELVLNKLPTIIVEQFTDSFGDVAHNE